MNNEQWMEEFDQRYSEEHGGLYWGKDEDGNPQYLPESALDDIKSFLTTQIELAEKRGREQAIRAFYTHQP